ncbi:hypothetical protein [Thiothrix nivea]|uniref:Uncharacterized protein n=1 Tax=Thiothrix nivea (strain ATCC 35100 / DSM 5205 / JP2) TaxID=870187 RepID=A0A656HHJ5_THINJ|nr:hypothetical protein [Thiothrix nivea]EIJ35504.1 hypothetical protein Thini_2978 [Thiothrix nivea DSM 5205]
MKKKLPILSFIGCLISINVFADSQDIEDSVFSDNVGVSVLSMSEMKETEGSAIIVGTQLGQAFSSATGIGGIVGVGVGVALANNISTNIVLPPISINIR